jgi:hypothetical protein
MFQDAGQSRWPSLLRRNQAVRGVFLLPLKVGSRQLFDFLYFGGIFLLQLHIELLSLPSGREQMKSVILLIVAFFTMAMGAQAKNYIYHDVGSSLESEGYKLFAGDNIVNTVNKGNDNSAGYCNSVDENTSNKLGDISTIRSDNRLTIGIDTKISYSAACFTYNTVLERLKSADDIRRLWLLFADSVTDDYAAETLKARGVTEDSSVLIEMRRLAIVSKYIEIFTKNKDWKLSEYTFLSQAFKARKDKPLSPAFCQFITALLTGDTEKAFLVVKSIDIDSIGSRFVPPVTSGPAAKQMQGRPGVSDEQGLSPHGDHE